MWSFCKIPIAKIFNKKFFASIINYFFTKKIVNPVINHRNIDPASLFLAQYMQRHIKNKNIAIKINGKKAQSILKK